MNNILKRLKETKVLENYSFMTVLQLFNVLISLIVYPFVIRIVGAEAYGVYVFAQTIIAYFQIVIDFGFDAPSMKRIVECRNDMEEQSRVLSAVFTAKHILLLPVLAVIVLLVLFVPAVREDRLLYACLCLQLYTNILFPSWYFQATKNMRLVTTIQVLCRSLTIPLIFLFIRAADDIVLYALFVNGCMLLGGIVAMQMLRRKGLHVRFLSIGDTKLYFREATPFFLTGLAGNLKEGLLTTLVGLVFGMRDVAVYDLAKKVVAIPRMFTQNINGALFPEIVSNPTEDRVRRVMRYERLIGLCAAFAIALLGYPAILLLGGKGMMDAYPLAVVLSLTLYTWLVVGGYLNFVFIPRKQYYHITRNQVVALLSTILFCGAGLLLERSLMVVACGLTLSGFVEILYCRYLCRK